MTAACGLCETELQAGYLCPGDCLALAKRLDRMGALWRSLSAFLVPGSRRPELGRTRPADPPLPVAEPVLDLRVGMALQLESWRSFMQSDRGWGEPVIPGSVERRIIVAARALSINLDWMAASWPPVGDLAEEMRDLEKAVLSIVDPPDPRTRGKRLGYCVASHSDGSVCGAVLRHYPGQTSVTCPWCSYTYGPRDWLTLKAHQPAEDTTPTPERTPS